MVDVTIEGDKAAFSVEGLHKLWCFRGRLEVPLAHITDVEVDPDQVGRWWHGVKILGTDVPGFFAGGRSLARTARHSRSPESNPPLSDHGRP